MNGDLISAAEAEGCDVLITTDQNLNYQQNLEGRTMAIIVLKKTSWPRIQRSVDRIVAEIESVVPGDYKEIKIG